MGNLLSIYKAPFFINDLHSFVLFFGIKLELQSYHNTKWSHHYQIIASKVLLWVLAAGLWNEFLRCKKSSLGDGGNRIHTVCTQIILQSDSPLICDPSPNRPFGGWGIWKNLSNFSKLKIKKWIFALWKSLSLINYGLRTIWEYKFPNSFGQGFRKMIGKPGWQYS